MIIKKVIAEAGNWRKRINDLADYIASASVDDDAEKCLATWGTNFFSQNHERMKAELAALVESSDVSVPTERHIVQHWIMSWGEMEKPSLDDIKKAADKFLQEMDLEKHQAIMGVHINTENIHVHMMVSRIDPENHKTKTEWNDTLKAHAILAGIEKSMHAHPERNALFTWNICQGAIPNPKYRPRNSVSFAHASPETIVVELPKGLKPEFSTMKRKGDCWYYPGSEDASAILYENKIYFLNWAYKDTILEIKDLKEQGATIIAQKDLAPVFMDKMTSESRARLKEWTKATFADGDIDVFTGLPDAPIPEDPLLRFRARPPTFPLDIREMRHKRNPWKYWSEVKKRYERKNVAGIRLETLCALHMRAHSFPRRDIEYCLLRDNMDTQYARHVTRWLYSARGNMELFRQKMQGSLIMEKESSLKKRPTEKKKNRKTIRMRLGRYGHLMVGDGEDRREDKPPRQGQRTIQESLDKKKEARLELLTRRRKSVKTEETDIIDTNNSQKGEPSGPSH